MGKRFITALVIAAISIAWRWIIEPPPDFITFFFACIIAFGLALVISYLIWWIVDKFRINGL